MPSKIHWDFDAEDSTRGHVCSLKLSCIIPPASLNQGFEAQPWTPQRSRRQGPSPTSSTTRIGNWVGTELVTGVCRGWMYVSHSLLPCIGKRKAHFGKFLHKGASKEPLLGIEKAQANHRLKTLAKPDRNSVKSKSPKLASSRLLRGRRSTQDHRK